MEVSGVRSSWETAETKSVFRLLTVLISSRASLSYLVRMITFFSSSWCWE